MALVNLSRSKRTELQSNNVLDMYLENLTHLIPWLSFPILFGCQEDHFTNITVYAYIPWLIYIALLHFTISKPKISQKL